jgi:hypothetical protein
MRNRHSELLENDYKSWKIPSDLTMEDQMYIIQAEFNNLFIQKEPYAKKWTEEFTDLS